MKRLTRSEKRRKSGNPSRTNCARSIAQHTASCHRERERESEVFEVGTQMPIDSSSM